MKISRIIFTTYFSLLGLFFISLMVMGFIYKDEKGLDKLDDIDPVTFKMESFKYISVGEGCHITLKNGQNRQLLYYKDKRKGAVSPVFEIKNDTLFIKSTLNNINEWCDIVCDSIIGITGKSCDIQLDSLVQPTLSVHLHSSHLGLSENSKIGKLSFVLKDSTDVSGWISKGSELKLEIQNSKIQIYSDEKLNLIEGSAAYHSEIYIPGAKHIKMDIDETSDFRMN